MDETRLRILLTQSENANLEFKEAFYKLTPPKDETWQRQRAELIKDILALANGNANVAGEPSYLIIGVADLIGPDGDRAIHGVGDLTVKPSQILQMVNAACEPPIEDLLCEIIPIDNKNVLVMTIPASPHLHETTKDLKTSHRTFTERTVLIRRNETVGVASARDRAAIQTLKTTRLNAQQNAPPIRFGLLIGAVLGKVVGDAVAQDTTHKQKRLAYQVSGVLFGSVLGAAMGNTYRSYQRMRRQLRTIPKRWKPAVLGGYLAGGVGLSVIAQRLWEEFDKRLQKNTPVQ